MTVALRGRRAALQANISGHQSKQCEQVCLQSTRKGADINGVLTFLATATTTTQLSESFQRLKPQGIDFASITLLNSCGYSSSDAATYSWRQAQRNPVYDNTVLKSTATINSAVISSDCNRDTRSDQEKLDSHASFKHLLSGEPAESVP